MVASVGRLGVGQENYYLRAVTPGVEGYYLDAGEAPGYWTGAGAASFGLAGEVRASQLRAVLAGAHPHTGESLIERAHPRRRPGFDVTFSAPKSASLLYALGDPATSEAVRRAHDAAVDAALGYLERHACAVRRGKGGAVQHPGDGLVGAAFRQRTSRENDPQLHTQVVIANIARGPDGRWSALDARLVYLHLMSAAAVYRVELRWRTARELDVGWTMRGDGLAELSGVDAAVLRRFSQRRAQVTGRLGERGESSAAAAQVATLDTRARKDPAATFDALLPGWRRDAAGLGFDPASLPRREQPVRAPREAIDAAAIERLLSASRLTAQRASFDRRDVIRALCAALPDGASAVEVEALADQVLRHRDVVPLLPTREVAAGGLARDQLVVPAGGKPAGTPLAGQRRYTTAELLTVEVATLARAQAGQHAQVARVDDASLDAAFAARPTLSDEQRAMVRALTTGGAGMAVVVGKAGTGKTYALDAARDAWTRAGYTVLGAAVAARAAAELEDGSAIPSMTLTRLLGQLAKSGGFGPNHVLVVDEAGMVGTRVLHTLTQWAADAGTKLVLVGDDKQLPPIDAGGLFRLLARRLGAIELTENRRQADPRERAALDELRHGNVALAVAMLDAAGRVVVADTAEQTREMMVAGWWVARQRWADPDGGVERRDLPILLAARRSDVADLNARARALMAAGGHLHGPDFDVSTPAGSRRFAVGDTVLATKNRYRLGLLNGNRGSVTAIDDTQRTLTVELTSGRTVTVPAAYIEAGHLDHGYASTIHKAQGMTAGEAFLLGYQLTRQAGYTGLSRGRIRNALYVTLTHPADTTARLGADDDAPGDRLGPVVRDLARSGEQHAAHDHLTTEPTAAAGGLATATDAALHAAVVEGQRVGQNQPPDVSGWISAARAEHERATRRLRADTARLDALRDELAALGPLARRARREAENRIDLAERAVAAGRGRLADLDDQLADLATQHVTRLTWEASTASVRDRARVAADELARRGQPAPNQEERERVERENRREGRGR